MFSRVALCVLGVLAAFFGCTTSFTLNARGNSQSHTALHATSGRRAFVGAIVASTVISSPVFADEGGAVDDLSMPTSDQKDEVIMHRSYLLKKSPETRQLQRRMIHLRIEYRLCTRGKTSGM